MKIGQVSSCFPPSIGGVETYVYQLCAGLAKRGHQVEVVTTSRGLPLGLYVQRLNGIRVVRFPEAHHLLETPLLPQVLTHLGRDSYDLLHLHSVVPTLTEPVLLLAKYRRWPVVLTYHSDPIPSESRVGRAVSGLYHRVAQAIPALADLIVATNLNYAAASRILRRYKDRITIIPPGVDTARYRPVATRGASSHRILFVGKLLSYKGLPYLMQALTAILRHVPDAQLDLVGDGPLRPTLQRYVHHNGLANHVTFHGWLSRAEVIAHYQQSRLLVLPSIPGRESFGMVLLEAQACGTPAVATDIPGPGSIVRQSGAGLLVPPKDPMRLAAAIVRLLLDDALYYNLRAKALEHAQRFSWSFVVDKYERLYHDLLVEWAS